MAAKIFDQVEENARFTVWFDEREGYTVFAEYRTHLFDYYNKTYDDVVKLYMNWRSTTHSENCIHRLCNLEGCC